jgi:hypothetical protein
VESGSTDCLNCGAPLTGEFCASCGQKRLRTDLALGEFLRETTEELTHWEGKVPRTLKTLLTRPGELTREFLAGRRARWLPPLRVYIVCSLLFFVAKPMVEAMSGRSAREMAKISITNEDGTVSPETRQQIEQGLPARIFGSERLLRAAQNPRMLNEQIDASFPKAMFILLPLFALFTNIAWRKRARLYPAHLYAALHIHAAWFVAMFVSTILAAFAPDRIAMLVGLAMVAYMVWYATRAFRRIYEESWPRTLAKTAVVGVLYLMSLMLVSIGLLGLALFTM